MSQPMDPGALQEVASLRQEYATADLVLEDALNRCVGGAIDEEELVFTLEQHRLSYETYVAKVHEHVKRTMEEHLVTG